jgi:hypothetical protein
MRFRPFGKSGIVVEGKLLHAIHDEPVFEEGSE